MIAKLHLVTQRGQPFCSARMRCERCGARIILSNSSAPRTRELYRAFDIHEVDARRNVNCDAGKRGAIKELIIT